MAVKHLAITYPGYGISRNEPAQELESQWKKYQKTLVPSDRVRPACMTKSKNMGWMGSCASGTWSILKMSFYCCITLLTVLLLQPKLLELPQFQLDRLNETLRNNVIGQEFAVNHTVNSISHYLLLNDFRLPLVLLLVGCSGCGKTYTMSLVLSSYPLTTVLVASHHTTSVHVDKDDLTEWLRYNVVPWRANIFTIDDVALNDRAMLRHLKDLFSKWEDIVTIKDVPTVFFLALNGGSVIAEEYALRKLAEKGKVDADLYVLQQEYRELLPDWMSSFEVVPFVPMAREHVKECIRRGLANMNEDVREELVERTIDELHFYPVEDPTFSDAGCKAVPVKSSLSKFSKDISTV